MSNAHIALQLSTRGGLEVKVSEALHKDISVIVSRAGRILLQVIDGKGGYLVETCDFKVVAKHLHRLFTDADDCQRMKQFAVNHVSNEVGTLAIHWPGCIWWTLCPSEKILSDSARINDIARENAGVTYGKGETRLPRYESLDLHREGSRWV
jgi:alpha,alpha-trehalose phosphorylase (configuration-retaining)